MLEGIYIAIQGAAIILLSLSFVKFNGKRQHMMSGIAMMMFLYLAFASMNIQTSPRQTRNLNVTYEYNGTETIDGVRVPTINRIYNYNTDCTTCDIKDEPQSYFNMGLGLLSLITTIGIWLIQKGTP